MADPRSERASLLAEIRAHLDWEQALGGFGVPVAERALPTPERVELAAHPAPSAPAPERLAHAAPPSAARVASEPPAFTADDAAPRAHLASLAPRSEPLGPEARRVRLAQLEQEVRGCTRCELARGRTKTVFARGNPESPLVFIGEGPGQDEDLSGLPFVGPAGKLLDKMIAAMGYGRDDVYICNVVKCRPPGNRTPLPSEAGACAPYLLGQIEAVAPQVIVALGRCAAENLGLVPAGGSWRGRWGKFQGIDVMPTYHPAFLLRSPEFKRPVWEDLQKVMAKLKSP